MKKPRHLKSQRKNNLSSTNNITPAAPSAFTIAYTTSYIKMLITDGARILAGHYRCADSTKDIQRLESRMQSEGFGFATKTLPCLVKGLLELYEGHDANFPQFKQKRGTKHPVFLHRLFHLALESTNPELKRNAFDILYSISVAFKKYRGPYSKTVLLKQFQDFVKVDDELGELDLFEPGVYSIMELARSKIANWMSAVTLEDVKGFLPRPGPGATNTPTEKTERYRPRVLYNQINDVLDYQEWWYPTLWDACLRSTEFLSLYKNRVDEPVARFKFVQKQQDKPRGICIEENEMQVMQQAVRVFLYDLFKRKFYPNIALSEQQVNAKLALRSSADLLDATIDMSEASDRISRELVSWLFQDNQMFHDILMALSTRWIEPPKELSAEFPNLIRTKKFAPMGSALCFPIMTMVHYALVLSIIEHNTYKTNMQDLISRVYVYGDDIVLPSETAEDVFAWLPSFGMKLNKTKSFVKSHFRESCGIHAYNGVDITPVYQKYTPYHSSGAAIASAYAVESQLMKKGFLLTAEFQRKIIGEQYHYNDVVPEGSAQAGFSRSFSTQDEHVERLYKMKRRRKWNSNLQCWMFKVDSVKKGVKQKVIENDFDAYLRWLWTHTKNEGPSGHEFGKSTIGDSHGDLIICQRRVPESALMEQKVNGILEKAIQRYPTSRVFAKRDSVVCHRVVLRQRGSLQQVGAHEMCAFC